MSVTPAVYKHEWGYFVSEIKTGKPRKDDLVLYQNKTWSILYVNRELEVVKLRSGDDLEELYLDSFDGNYTTKGYQRTWQID